ncbi:MAG TPA: ABC transporter ATP-binding protein [Gemmatimonadales bacterium]
MISYRGLTKDFGAVRAVDGVDLDVRPGETLALIGPNGSGKTTTLKALVGLVRPTAGRITLDGIDVIGEGAAARRRLGYLPQRLTFPEGITAREVVDYFARLRGLDVSPIPLLARVGLAAAAGRAVDGFSGGMRQRLGIALALLGEPAALILDEPSAALDPSGALMVRDILTDIRREGTTILISSHDLGEVAALADRIAVFVAGRIVATGSLAELEVACGARGIEPVYRALSTGIRAERVRSAA